MVLCHFLDHPLTFVNGTVLRKETHIDPTYQPTDAGNVTQYGIVIYKHTTLTHIYLHRALKIWQIWLDSCKSY